MARALGQVRAAHGLITHARRSTSDPAVAPAGSSLFARGARFAAGVAAGVAAGLIILALAMQWHGPLLAWLLTWVRS